MKYIVAIGATPERHGASYKLRRRLGLPENRFQDLTYFYAMRLRREGISFQIVAQRLGDRGPRVTASIFPHPTND